MKLWLLHRRTTIPKGDDPWGRENHPSDDAVVRVMVVRAESEIAARKLAQDNGGDEVLVNDFIKPWKDSRYSMCLEVRKDGEAQVVAWG